MPKLKAKPDAIDSLVPVGDEEIAPAHRVWMNEQIEKAMEQKRRGTATYKSLEEIRRKFGF
jgi:hypothetical protein